MRPRIWGLSGRSNLCAICCIDVRDRNLLIKCTPYIVSLSSSGTGVWFARGRSGSARVCMHTPGSLVDSTTCHAWVSPDPGMSVMLAQILTLYLQIKSPSGSLTVVASLQSHSTAMSSWSHHTAKLPMIPSHHHRQSATNHGAELALQAQSSPSANIPPGCRDRWSFRVSGN